VLVRVRIALQAVVRIAPRREPGVAEVDRVDGVAAVLMAVPQNHADRNVPDERGRVRLVGGPQDVHRLVRAVGFDVEDPAAPVARVDLNLAPSGSVGIDANQEPFPGRDIGRRNQLIAEHGRVHLPTLHVDGNGVRVEQNDRHIPQVIRLVHVGRRRVVGHVVDLQPDPTDERLAFDAHDGVAQPRQANVREGVPQAVVDRRGPIVGVAVVDQVHGQLGGHANPIALRGHIRQHVVEGPTIGMEGVRPLRRRGQRQVEIDLGSGDLPVRRGGVGRPRHNPPGRAGRTVPRILAPTAGKQRRLHSAIQPAVAHPGGGVAAPPTGQFISPIVQPVLPTCRRGQVWVLRTSARLKRESVESVQIVAASRTMDLVLRESRQNRLAPDRVIPLQLLQLQIG